MNQSNILFLDGEYGKIARIRGPFSRNDLIASREEVQELELNYAWGWDGEDLDFLFEFPSLLRLMLLDRKVHNLAPIQSLHKLKSLQVQTSKNSSGLDLHDFKSLELMDVN